MIRFMLVVGAKVDECGSDTVRSRFAGDEGQKSLADFIAAVKEEIEKKEIREVEKAEEE